MTVCSVHLAETTLLGGLRVVAQRWRRRPPAGLLHAEWMLQMGLGAPLLSPQRVRPRRVAVFAVWESEDAIDAWLADDPHGRRWAGAWHVRLAFLRRWGSVAAVDGLLPGPVEHDPAEPVVAVTLARVRLLQVPRFIRWGRPVEQQVRDDPGQVLALAAGAPLRTVSTFTVWRSAQAMTDMVAGRTGGARARHHVAAMQELARRDFHHEFTTLRFRCLSEHGSWEGRSGIVPTAGAVGS